MGPYGERPVDNGEQNGDGPGGEQRRMGPFRADTSAVPDAHERDRLGGEGCHDRCIGIRADEPEC